MSDTDKDLKKLTPTARRAWRQLEREFPMWVSHLDIRDGELEFAVPAPDGSQAGHLIAFSDKENLWIRFAPSYMCYPVDDEKEMVSVMRKLIADEVVFRVTMKGDEWMETTLTYPSEADEPRPGHFVRCVSWSGKFDR